MYANDKVDSELRRKTKIIELNASFVLVSTFFTFLALSLGWITVATRK